MIGKVIAKLLKEHSDLTDIVPDNRIYPYVMNEGTPLPAIIYTINSATPVYTKDGWVNDNVSFSVVAFSRSYNDLQDIAKEIRFALEMEQGTEGVTIHNIYVSGIDEGFNISEDVFLCRLTFTTKLIGF